MAKPLAIDVMWQDVNRTGTLILSYSCRPAGRKACPGNTPGTIFP